MCLSAGHKPIQHIIPTSRKSFCGPFADVVVWSQLDVVQIYIEIVLVVPKVCKHLAKLIVLDAEMVFIINQP